MDKLAGIDIFLVVINIVVWLGPFLVSVRRRTISLLHPASCFPLYLVFTVLVAMTEHWFGWSMRSPDKGLRIETRLYENLPNFFTEPLFIMFLVGIAYHIGIYKACGRVVASEADRTHLTQNLKFERSGRKKLTVITGGIAALCLVPFYVFGQVSGFFWTLGFLYAYSFLPIVLMNQWKSAGLLLWFLGLPAMFLLDSKGNFIYHLLPLIIFYQGGLLFSKRHLNIRKVALIVSMLAIVFFGTQQLTVMRGEYSEEVPLVYNVIVREYGFEVFAVLVHKISWMGQFSEGSWSVLEITEIIPRGLLPWAKERAGVRVAELFLPSDYYELEGAGFNRFFMFAFYHDFGWAGAIAGGFIIGYLFGALYRAALRVSFRKKVLCPLLIYLPIPVYSQYFSEGNFAFAIIFSVISSLVIMTVSILARQKTNRFS